MRITVRKMLAGTSLAAALAIVPGAATPAMAVPPALAAASTACGSPLSAAEVRTVAALSDTGTVTGADDLARFDEQVRRNHEISVILARHRDWRGLFVSGLDAAEQAAVSPLQHDPSSFADPAFGHAFSPELLSRFLLALHRDITGQPGDPHWNRYFELTRQCGEAPARVALAGYNAHFAVDVSYALAAVHAGLQHTGDYLKISGAVAQRSQVIVDRTKQDYGVDIGPLGQAVVATSPGIGTVAFVNAIALQNPLLTTTTQAEIDALWRGTDLLLPVLATGSSGPH